LASPVFWPSGDTITQNVSGMKTNCSRQSWNMGGGGGGGDMQRIFRETHGQFDRQIDS
jgi:hypothetical protein